MHSLWFQDCLPLRSLQIVGRHRRDCKARLLHQDPWSLVDREWIHLVLWSRICLSSKNSCNLMVLNLVRLVRLWELSKPVSGLHGVVMVLVALLVIATRILQGNEISSYVQAWSLQVAVVLEDVVGCTARTLQFVLLRVGSTFMLVQVWSM